MGSNQRITGAAPSARRAIALAIAALSLANAAALAVHEERPAMNAAASAPAAGTGLDAPGTAAAPGSPSSDAAPAPAVKGPAPAKPAGAKPTTTTTLASIAAERIPVGAEGYQYEAGLTPSCVRVGEMLHAWLRVKPNVGSSGSFMPFYADGTTEKGKAAVAEGDGTLHYSWPARPVPGEGRLVTQAMDGETKTFGSKVLAFRVVEAGGSC